MPLDTSLEGDPASIRACVGWLRHTIVPSIDACVVDMQRASRFAGSGWQGMAGSEFQVRIESGGKKADELRVGVERAANSFDAYADDLHAAQVGMERARHIAVAGGLQLAGNIILDPGPAPQVPMISATQPTSIEIKQHNAAIAAFDVHAAKVQAYNVAAEEVKRSNKAMEAARKIAKNIWDDLRGKSFLHATDIVGNAAIGGLLAQHVSILRKQAAAYMSESKLAQTRYLQAPGGSPQARALNTEAYRKFLDADEYAKRADVVGRRIGSKIPVIGIGITAAGIGYDVHQGKPVGKAVISGTGGALAAAGTGALVGTAIGGPVGTVAGAVVGLGVGLVASSTLDWGYDELPDNVQTSIEDGFNEVGGALGNAGEAVGDGAMKVWDAIF
ncbi:hypothetical protein [Salinispora mooreana]|uniref:hypothetical protein n=1 Tax=Salinispora mooreana TaxID=999545 RepID=UPI0013A585F3|nr:hypothetical protein [Salinispora mooreana]